MAEAEEQVDVRRPRADALDGQERRMGLIRWQSG